MRLLLATLAAVVMALPAARADTLSVPTFTISYGGYGDGNVIDYPAGPGGISVVSSSAKATTLGLDHVGQYMQIEGGWSIASSTQAYTSIQFQAAEGYQITGIEFSTTVSGILAAAEIPVNAVRGDSSDGFNIASAYAGIGGTQTALYFEHQVTDAVTLGGLVENTAGLGVFDYQLQVGAMAQAASSYYWVMQGGEPVEYFSVGTAALQYLNPTLTIHTQALAVPEPATWAMMAGGLILLAARRPRRS